MNPPPPDLLDQPRPPATRADRAWLAILFLGVPAGVALCIWWNL